MSALDAGADVSGAATTRGWIAWLAAAGAVLAAFLVLSLLAEGFAPAPTGPANSSLATTSGGVAAWAELLARTRHPVVALRTGLDAARLDPGSTLVVLGASDLSAAEAGNLKRFMDAGGHLVIGGGDPRAAVSRLVSAVPAWAGSGPQDYRLPGVSDVRTTGQGAWLTPTATLLVTRAYGSGRLLALADSSPLQNRLLAVADNAQFGLALAGPGRPVVFAEALHGYGQATGLAAIPTRWWLALGGLGLAGLLWVLSCGRRLGPAERQPAPPAPPRGAYIESLATAVARARDREQLAELAREAGIEPTGRAASAAAVEPISRPASAAGIEPHQPPRQ